MKMDDLPEWFNNYKLPCDVRLPPRTTIKRGCALTTLIVGIIARETLDGQTPAVFADTHKD